MLDALFISDLHLHPDIPVITKRFNAFMDWAVLNARKLYILGDFFHVWPGDDGLDAWSLAIAEKLAESSRQGLQIYFMHGNRDFLLGEKFAALAGMTLLKDPTLIQLGEEKIVLAHGDAYCTLDKSHQYFRKLTRNALFIKIFLKIPFKFRQRMVQKVRDKSEQNRQKEHYIMDVVPEVMIQSLERFQSSTMVHGHIHRPGLNKHSQNGKEYRQFVLSDWDDIPKLLCYDNSKGFLFIQPLKF